MERLQSLRDIDRRLTRKERRAAGRQTWDPLREFGHDLLQPAATISALVAAVRLQPGLSEAVTAYLDHIESEARHFSAACHFLLRDEPERRPVSVDAVVKADA